MNFENNFEHQATHSPNHESPVHPLKPDDPNHPENPPHFPERPISIIVNGVDKQLTADTKHLTYEDVVSLAYGSYNNATNIIYTVAYSNGPKENPKGSMVKGQKVKVREGMIFNVSRSDKS